LVNATICPEYNGFYGNPLADGLPVTQQEISTNPVAMLTQIDNYTSFLPG